MRMKGVVFSLCLILSAAPFETANNCSDGCQLTHQTVGVTNFTVTVAWGAGSSAGICNPIPESPGHCQIAVNCYFGRYSVTATGTGAARWRDPVTGQYGPEIEISGSDTVKYGSAATPEEVLCGNGAIQVTFPDDLAGGGPKCTECN
jgi:hypothetical protein